MVREIRAMFIFEILGKPPEHLISTLNELVDNLGETPGIKIESKKIHDAKLVEKEGMEGLYTSFAEVEMTFEGLDKFLAVAFNFLPSHVEVIEPEEFKLTNSEMSEIMTQNILKLHKYDEIAKALKFKITHLEKQLQEKKD